MNLNWISFNNGKRSLKKSANSKSQSKPYDSQNLMNVVKKYLSLNEANKSKNGNKTSNKNLLMKNQCRYIIAVFRSASTNTPKKDLAVDACYSVSKAWFDCKPKSYECETQATWFWLIELPALKVIFRET